MNYDLPQCKHKQTPRGFCCFTPVQTAAGQTHWLKSLLYAFKYPQKITLLKKTCLCSYGIKNKSHVAMVTKWGKVWTLQGTLPLKLQDLSGSLSVKWIKQTWFIKHLSNNKVIYPKLKHDNIQATKQHMPDLLNRIKGCNFVTEENILKVCTTLVFCKDWFCACIFCSVQ